MRKKIVFVGMSGGVDSSLSALLLKKAGYEVVGVFIKTWHPDFLECNEEEERRDAMRVAAFLDIPFLTFDLEDIYKKEVGEYMINEYKKGRTPNPDVMCNKHVKFGAFLKKAISMGADYVATGHYAQIKPGVASSQDFLLRNVNHSKKQFQLLKGADGNKDQSYFLWTLGQKELSKVIFPVGHLRKSKVRELALKYRLPVAEKKDSQGICFLGPVDLKEFLSHYIKQKKGNVLNEKGEIVGYHNGVTFFTIGERRGFTITKKTPEDKPYYIVAKDIKNNTLIVSQNKNSDTSLSKKVYKLEKTNWISITPEKNKKYKAEIRYHGEYLSCKLEIKKGHIAEIFFDNPILISPGQSVVVYDEDVCLGGGVVI